MHKPSSVLRLLLLVTFVGGLGIVQPTAAQQTVTLSGRVTDAAGQPVSGTTVSLFRLPDDIWTDGQGTDGTSAYRLSGSPGTYNLVVQPPHGPFIAQRQEVLLSTNTTQNIVLETGVTLSGLVADPAGQPVPGVYLSVRNEAGQEISFAWTDTGHYSLGVPVGTYQIRTFNDAFPNTTVEGVMILQATVLNITLEAGVVLGGKVVDDEGQPVPDARVCAYPPEEWREGERTCSHTDPEGSFQLGNIFPAMSVVTVTPPAPLQPTRRQLEVSGRGVPGLVLTVSRQPMPFVPDDPPKAALVSISAPTADGEVTLSGAAGSVAPGSTVFVATLDTEHFTTAQATDSGSFTATLFAPAGTSVLIKADPVGTSVAQFLALFFVPGKGDEQKLSALPGTILRVPDPPGTGIPIGGAGRIKYDALPAWTFHGSLNTQTLAPGDSLRVRGTVRVESPAVQGVDALRLLASLQLERLSNTDGSGLLRHRRNSAASIFLTPTGLPIEREARWWDDGLSQGRNLSLVKTTATQAEAEVDLTLPLPSDLPAGYYRPLLTLGFPDMPIEHPPSRPFTDGGGVVVDTVRLPIITVGSPAPPHLYWELLLDTLSNGARGVVAVEDADRFGVAQRILTPSDTFVIPRLEAASGQPLTYRLEPFAPTVGLLTSSFGDLPGPPRIPFQYPSGSLTVTIRHPDGTKRVLGPAPFVQSRLKSLVDDEGTLLDNGGDISLMPTNSPPWTRALTSLLPKTAYM